MIVKVESKLMKVGNSMAIILPTVVCQNYGLKKGESMTLALHEDGIIIPKSMIDISGMDHKITLEPINRGPVAP